jgi:hypothetical protein
MPSALPTPPQEPKIVVTPLKKWAPLGLALIMDIARAFFAYFFITGPALIGGGAAATAHHYLGWAGAVGDWISAGIGTIAAGIGLLGDEILGPFGIVMAEALGFLGFTAVYLLLFFEGITLIERIFSMIYTFVVCEAPLVDAIPILTISAWQDIRAEEKKDKARQKEYEEKMAVYMQQIQARQEAARLAAYQSMQEEAFMQAAANDAVYQQEAANEAAYAAAANDASYEKEIPDRPRLAA